MNLQQIFSEAVQLHMRGELNSAREKYQQLLDEVPDNVNVLGNLGIVCRDLGNLDEALEYGHKAVTIGPSDPAQHLNLGAIYEAKYDLAQARSCYEKCLELSPAHPKALNNLGKIMHLQGDVNGARTFFNRALSVEPQYPMALNNLGVLLSEQGEHENAAEHLQKSHELEPENQETLFNLAGVFNCLGEKEKAGNLLQKLVELNPKHSSAKHLLAALRGESTEAAPREYIVDTFDRYAERFDEHLQKKLGYDVPLVLAEMIEKAYETPHFSQVLDLGCGTGLSGAAFAPFTGELVGVDLSEKMLEKARQKDIYTLLANEEVLTFMQETGTKYDLFIATDLFIYIGMLDPIFAAISGCAQPGAMVACSIERHDGDEEYVLRESGRYAQRPDYLESVAAKHGFGVRLQKEHTIRKENGQWIAGNVYILHNLKK